MKKILIITTDFRGADQGRTGHSIRMTSLADFLKSNGAEVSLLLTTTADIDKETVGHPIINYEAGVLTNNQINLNFVAHFLMENDIRYIITSSPPLINNQFGFELKKILGDAIFWICDVRDHASLHPLLRPKNLDKLLSLRHVESQLAYHADLNTLVSSYSITYQKALGLAFDLPVKNERITCIENGANIASKIDTNTYLERKIKAAKRSGKVIFCYFGTGNITLDGKNKNLSPLLRILSENEHKDRVFFLACGVIKVDELMVSDFQNNIELVVHPPIKYNEARNIMRISDVGININVDKEHAPTIIGGKIYDYLVEPLSIFAIMPENSISMQELQLKHPNKITLANVDDTSDIRSKVRTILNRLSNPNSEKNEQLNVYFRENQYNKLLNTVNTLDNDGTNNFYDETYENNQLYKLNWKDSIYADSWKLAINYLDHITDGQNYTFADIGCGNGQFAEALAELSKNNFIYKGYDFSLSAIKAAKERLNDSRFSFFHKDAFDLNISNKFIICFEVLEHMRDDKNFFNKIPSKTRILFSVPNFPAKTHFRFFRDLESVKNRYSDKINILDCFETTHNASYNQKIFYVYGERI